MGYGHSIFVILLLCRRALPDLVSTLTAFINMVLAGRCPSDVAPVFLEKSGGIRPIAIGFTLRRLVSGCAEEPFLFPPVGGWYTWRMRGRHPFRSPIS